MALTTPPLSQRIDQNYEQIFQANAGHFDETGVGKQHAGVFVSDDHVLIQHFELCVACGRIGSSFFVRFCRRRLPRNSRALNVFTVPPNLKLVSAIDSSW